MKKTKKYSILFSILLIIGMMGYSGCGSGGSGGSDNNEIDEPSTLTLSVEKFGDGIITSNISGIDCGKDCTASFKENSSIILSATAHTDSEFLYWVGCDSVSNENCTVTMNSNRTVLPTFIMTDLVVSNATKVLNDNTMQHLALETK